VALARGVFLRDRLSRERWFCPGVLDRFARHQRRTGQGLEERRGACWFFQPPQVLEELASDHRTERAPPSEPQASPPWCGWQQGPAVLVVDLDAVRAAQAVAIGWWALPWVLRGAAGEDAIAAGRSQEWDSKIGTLRTPADTQTRWRAQRTAAEAALERSARRVLPGPRWRSGLWRDLQDRARQRGTSPEAELRAEVSRGFEAIRLAERVRRYVATLPKLARAHPAAPLPAVTQAYRALFAGVGTELGRYLDDAIRSQSRWRDEGPRHEVRVPDRAIKRLQESLQDDPAFDEFLEGVYQEELARAVQQIVPRAEAELCLSLLDGESRREYADRTGRSRSTVDNQVKHLRQNAALRRRLNSA